VEYQYIITNSIMIMIIMTITNLADWWSAKSEM